MKAAVLPVVSIRLSEFPNREGFEVTVLSPAPDQEPDTGNSMDAHMETGATDKYRDGCTGCLLEEPHAGLVLITP